jgi:hypothetical protein
VVSPIIIIAAHLHVTLFEGSPSMCERQKPLYASVELRNCRHCLGRSSVFPVISNISVTITVTINGRVFPLPF